MQERSFDPSIGFDRTLKKINSLFLNEKLDINEIRELLISNNYPSEVIDKLLLQLNEDLKNQQEELDRLESEGKDRNAFKNIFIGILLVIVGLLITFFSSFLFPNNKMILFYGLIIAGIFKFIQGLLEHSNPFKAIPKWAYILLILLIGLNVYNTQKSKSVKDTELSNINNCYKSFKNAVDAKTGNILDFIKITSDGKYKNNLICAKKSDEVYTSYNTNIAPYERVNILCTQEKIDFDTLITLETKRYINLFYKNNCSYQLFKIFFKRNVELKNVTIDENNGTKTAHGFLMKENENLMVLHFINENEKWKIDITRLHNDLNGSLIHEVNEKTSDKSQYLDYYKNEFDFMMKTMN